MDKSTGDEPILSLGNASYTLWLYRSLMNRSFPHSLIFFVATAGVFLLQVIPFTGVFLMFALAMFWSVLLVNAGMVGVAFEAARGNVSRWWLVLPLAFYGGYWTVAGIEHVTLQRLSASYEAANAGVATGFDPSRYALAFDSEGNGAWLTQNYALPVAYSANKNVPEGFLSHRLVDSAVCAKVRETPALGAAFVHAFGFSDDHSLRGLRLKQHFCDVSMPERPELPIVHVSQQTEQTYRGTLPVTQITTTITNADSSRFELLGGVAAPLSWFPKPVLGCALNSGAAKWECVVQFWRETYTPITSGKTRYDSDSRLLARALGLKPVAITDRQGADPAFVLQKAAALEEATLARQLANLDTMIADPSADTDWQTDVIRNHPDILASYADKIVDGLERAVLVPDNERHQTRSSGLILAGLLANLPQDKLVGFGPRLLALYAKVDTKHWLWETDTLKHRLRDLVPGAMPLLKERDTCSSGCVR